MARGGRDGADGLGLPTEAAGDDGRWRWVAFGAPARWRSSLCLLAALRPSIIPPGEEETAASLVFLIDGSTSMKINDEVSGQTRWEVAVEGPGSRRRRSSPRSSSRTLDVKVFEFDSELHEEQARRERSPTAEETDLGATLVERRQASGRANRRHDRPVADGANNTGIPPLAAADQLQSSRCRSSPSASAPRTPGPARRTSPSATSSPGRPSSSRTSPRSAA